MELKNLQKMAKQLTEARISACPIPQFSKIQGQSAISRAEAYRIQEWGIEHRVQRGEKWAGLKMGLTSEAKRRQMNLDSPLYGELTDTMMVPSRGVLSIDGLIHPKIEPEVAFLTGSDLKGEDVSREQVLAACTGVAPALEVLDSRYSEFQYFSMEDVISDNSSSSHFIIGEWVRDFTSIDLDNLPLIMQIDGQVAKQGNTQAISGDPVQSVIDLCGLLAQRGRSLEAGSIVLAGAATPAVNLQQGEVTEVLLKVEDLGEVSVSVR